MNTFQIILLIFAILVALGYAGYKWAQRKTSVRPDLADLDRQEDQYRYGILDRLGRRVKSVKKRWQQRGKTRNR